MLIILTIVYVTTLQVHQIADYAAHLEDTDETQSEDPIETPDPKSPNPMPKRINNLHVRRKKKIVRFRDTIEHTPKRSSHQAEVNQNTRTTQY